MYLHGWQVRAKESSPLKIRQVVYINKAVIDPHGLPKCPNVQSAGCTGHLGLIKQRLREEDCQ